jgi:NAD(P)-dependent dehydrogenase (short-subunit alcohol dehydrogenase family)
MGSVYGKVVFITGGARGIGANVARRLRSRGAKLVLTDIDAEPLAELAAELGAEHALTAVADVRDLAAMEAVAERALEKFGGIDVVLANAGIATFGSVQHVDPEAVKRLLDINVLGVFNTVRATLPAVIERQGYVLIVSSFAAYAAAPGLAPYHLSKAGVEHFANALRLEVAHQGVAVGSAHMSWIDTPLVQDAKHDLSSFTEMLSRLPYPLGKTTTVDKCGQAFIRGIEGRKRRINVPGWVGAFRWLKPVLSTPFGERPTIAFIPEILPRLDAETAALGRSISARIEQLSPPKVR